ncbi:DNA primase [Cysteiniphilum halobium]|uniref:DNA primase n=1 Tax=Cysteiniphilum halobium TaxID=2219059 RepID=UPI000E65A535|nr:DNA primase [Cysteiniphilum halobium]
MKGNIPADFIRQIVASTDIVEVISKYVTLKKTGKNFMACCPFHNEKTPSFSVSPDKQLYHCFGCHASGDVIDFIAEHNSLSFIEAVEELAFMQRLDVPYDNNSKDKSKDKLTQSIYAALQAANKYFQWCLRFDGDKDEVVEYIKLRGIEAKTAKYFQIGYAPNQWQALYDVLKKQFSLEVLDQAGLVIRKDKGGAYDRFRERLMFPIRNRKGLVVGFGGRVLPNKDANPKYLNSPETPVFFKSHELYGLYELKEQHKSPKHIMVVEGYMDVIGLYQHGYTTAVATLGTALSASHLKILFRHTSEIILCFDGDTAGQNAALRAFEMVLPVLDAHKKARFLLLPNAHDPDSYIKTIGLDGFKNALTQALSAADFFIQTLLGKYDLSSADSLAQLIEEARRVLKEIPESAYTLMIIEQLAKAVDVSSLQLQRMMKQKVHDVKRGENYVQLKRWQLNVTKLSLVEKALAYLLSMPSQVHNALIMQPAIEFECVTEQHFILLDALNIIRQNDRLSSAVLVQMLVEKYPQFKVYFYQLLQAQSELDAVQLIDELMAMLDKIMKQACQNELEHLILKAKTSILTAAEKQRMQAILYKVEKI